MTKGTQSFGKRQTKTHTLSRKTGKNNFHRQKKRDSTSGWGKSKKIRQFNWNLKRKQRTGPGTGRMRYMKTLTRRFKNGFRSGTKPKKRVKSQ